MIALPAGALLGHLVEINLFNIKRDFWIGDNYLLIPIRVMILWVFQYLGFIVEKKISANVPENNLT